MGEVINIRPKVDRQSQFHSGWVCGCGGQVWNLFADGKCVCVHCGCYSSKLKVIEADPDA